MGIMKSKKAASTESIIALQEAAAAKERKRLEREAADKEASDAKAALSAVQEAESKRRAFVGALSVEDDEEERRKFLKGV